MKIPGLTDLAEDVKRIADALTKLAEVAGELVEQQTTAAGQYDRDASPLFGMSGEELGEAAVKEAQKRTK